jgi:hypothetical protein
MRRSRALGDLAGRSHWGEKDARRIVDAWQESGEPVSRFAGRLRIDPRRVSRWAARLQAVRHCSIDDMTRRCRDVSAGPACRR